VKQRIVSSAEEMAKSTERWLWANCV